MTDNNHLLNGLRENTRARLSSAFDLQSGFSLVLLVSFVLIGVVGNLFSLPMFFGVDLLFGSIATMVVARRFGPLFGALAGLIASIYTIQLWGHPYALLIFTLEGFVVGLLSRKESGGSVIRSDALFWLFLGMPMVWWFYGHTLGLNDISVRLIMFKQVFNGVSNAIAAMALYQLIFGLMIKQESTAQDPDMQIGQSPKQSRKAHMGLADLMILSISVGVLIPVWIAITLMGRDAFLESQKHVNDDLQVMIDDTLTGVTRDISSRADGVTASMDAYLSGLLTEGQLDSLIDGPLRRQEIDGLQLYLDGNVVYQHFVEDFAELATWQLPDHGMLRRGAADRRSFALSGKFSSGGNKTELVVPIEVGEHLGLVFINTRAITTSSVLHRFPGVTALDIRSKTGGLMLVRDVEYILDRPAVRQVMDGGATLLAPEDPRLSAMRRWRETHLMQQGTVGSWSGGELQLRMSTSIVSGIDDVQRAHAVIMAMGLLILMFAVLISPMVIVLIDRPLRGLISAARTVVNDPEADVTWPQSPVHEMQAFRDNFIALISTIRGQTEDMTRLLETSNAPILSIDEEGRVQDWNQTLAKLTGISSEEAISRSLVDEMVASGYSIPMQRSIDEAVAYRSVVTTEVQLRCSDGGVAEILFTWTVRRDRDESVTSLIAIGQDVTGRKEAEAQIMQASKLATLGEMSTSVAHELNQPLNVIRLAASNCERRLKAGKADDDFLLGKLERINNHVTRAADIITHMRIFGRKATGIQEVVNVCEMIEQTFTLIGEQLRMNGIGVERDFRSPDAVVIGEEVHIKSLFLHLFNNSREAYLKREQTGVIEVVVEREVDEVVISIMDHAGGIPEDILPRIFEPFFTTKEIGQGTGLGLSVSYGIVSDMGGSMAAENSADGAAFIMRLPFASKKPD